MRRLGITPSVISAEFWKAADEHRLVVPRCNRTGTHFFPPERCVPGTLSTDWSYVESSGMGTVTTFTVVHRAPAADFDVPYVLAVVAVDEGWNYLTNIVGCDPDAVSIGMRVTVTYERIDDVTLPAFKPIDNP
ncbi:Zn-ribbon domain-containing OB-fold protein [Gordonia rhizosphera]|uniref:DUF35 domain-containing protein n=1 Tax=Gordonia rhizosphera NBRC 16068 TaxID=1108045 RepID=K6WEU6_9ACTN|nr:OB-fold domain-containing protein [Gordonia rhizosphera]GAB92271.1 hypothetical protein GORHZ_169_00170 [Gordonia rhizosphera NBRC 16068]